MTGASGKIQRVRLVRPTSGGFGFYIRGGAEHGLGIYVSSVETGSEAHLQGLRQGDQILRVCGMYVDQATHKEVINIIRDRNNLDLKVRSGGVIPIKDSRSHPVSWRIVKEDVVGQDRVEVEDGRREVDKDRREVEMGRREVEMDEGVKMEEEGGEVGRRSEGGEGGRRSNRGEGGTKSRSDDEADVVEERIRISLAGHQGLGCSICKGPPEKPGIFVQSTKAGKLAREVGLRPGDQIIRCNGIEFFTIAFGDAVYHLKASKELNLVIRKRAGLDLFPSESSGYDSSASSSVGAETDTIAPSTSTKSSPSIPAPPPPAPAPPPPTTNHLPVTKSSPPPRSEAELEIERERQKLLSEKERLWREQEQLEVERSRLEHEKEIFRSTIGKATGTEFSTNLENRNNSINFEIRNTSFHPENRTTFSHHPNGTVAPAPINNYNRSHPVLQPTPSDTSFLSVSTAVTVGSTPDSSSGCRSSDASESDSSGAGSLAAALQSEIRRRADKTPGQAGATKSILKKSESNKAPFVSEKNDKHDLLIAEFKRAHRRMFPGGEPEQEQEQDSPKVEDSSQAEDEPQDKPPNKNKAPPPPPLKPTTRVIPPFSSPAPAKSTGHSSIYSSITTINSEQSESRSLSTFKPDRGKESPVSKASSKMSAPFSLKGVGAPVFVPGIPTPDYDSTPDRSPHSHRKLYSRNRGIGKAVAPPTVEGISRAKSLTSLLSPTQDFKETRKTRAPAPGTRMGSAFSMKDVSKDTSEHSTITSIHSSLRSFEAPSLSFSYKSSLLEKKDEAGSVMSSRISQFSKRHREVEAVSMESFQIDATKSIEHKPPATYFESLKPSPLVTVQTYEEKDNFNFQTKPCHPSQIPDKPDGEEAKIASQDYRAANAQSTYSRYKPVVEVKTFKSSKDDKHFRSPKDDKTYRPPKDEKGRGGFAKFTGLKKPAPPPPVLRK